MNYISYKTLLVKFFGVCFASAGGLCVGTVEPLIHIGSILGMLMPYLPFKIMRYFRNDLEKRKF